MILDPKEYQIIDDVVILLDGKKQQFKTIRTTVVQEFINHVGGPNFPPYHEVTLRVTLRRECDGND